MSSYKKLKAENEKLKRDIYNLIVNEDKEAGIFTKMEYKILYDLYNVVWSGSVNLPVNNPQKS